MPRIAPRPIFRQAMALLETARCPECGRAFDHAATLEDYAPRIQPLHCSWCSQRIMALRDFRAWQTQDASARRRT